MKITEDKWGEIIKYYGNWKQTSIIGSVNNSGQPNLTPIGSLLLKEDFSGYYFDLFTRELSDNLDQNNQVCVLFVETGKLFWFKSFYTNKNSKPAGIKLIGYAGDRRRASDQELERLRSKTKPMQKLKGYKTIFGDPSYVRDINFTDYFIINTGKMTYKL